MVWYLRSGFPFALYKSQRFQCASKPPIQTINQKLPDILLMDEILYQVETMVEIIVSWISQTNRILPGLLNGGANWISISTIHSYDAGYGPIPGLTGGKSP